MGLGILASRILIALPFPLSFWPVLMIFLGGQKYKLRRNFIITRWHLPREEIEKMMPLLCAPTKKPALFFF